MSTTNTLTKAALKTLSLKALATKAGRTVSAAARRETVAVRKERLRADLEEFNVDRLLDLQTKMANFIDLVTLSLGDVEMLDEKSRTVLMSQCLGQRDIGEFVEVVRGKIKEIAFAHIDAALESDGVEDPANTNGYLEVPALGKKFCKEGAGFSDPSINEGELYGLLPEAVRDAVFVTKEVVKVERQLDLQLLFAAVEADPNLMTAIASSLSEGSAKTPKLVVRDL
jgi:hypothetical protein